MRCGSAMPLVAAAAINLFGRLHLRPVLRPLRGADADADGAVGERDLARTGGGPGAHRNAGLDPIRQACFKTASYAPLARLPVGFVVPPTSITGRSCWR